MITVKSFVFNPFMENTYVLYDETKACVIIDPGCYEPREKTELETFITGNQLQVTHLLNTHCHIDHVLGNDFVKSMFKVNLYAHKIEVPYLKAVQTYAPNYGFTGYRETEIDKYLEEGDVFTFGNSALEILFVPGHSAGHIAFYQKDQKFCIGGDVLFKGSIGRTDLPGGDYETLIKSIKNKILPLGDETLVYSGHGATTTVGEERKFNPFLN